MDALESGLGKLNLSTSNGPFITQPSFWESEGGGDNPATGAPLLDRNNGFLEPKEEGNQAILERAGRWISLCGADKVSCLPAVTALKGAGTSESIIWRDAERTFKSPSFRQQMITTLEKVADGDYHQGMGYLCGFLLLLLGPDDVSKVLHRVGTDDKYTPGYWKGQPEAFVRDAMVYMRLVQERLPDVAAHLNKAGLVPEAYAQKWFVGLCVHAMPFDALIDVFESFLADGHIFLFKLSLAIVSALAPAILETKPAEVNKLFELLRLDKKVFPDGTSPIFADILARAKAMELDAVHVAQLRRSEMEQLQAKLEKVRAREKELKEEDDDDEIVFSDEEDEEDEAARLARLAGN